MAYYSYCRVSSEDRQRKDGTTEERQVFDRQELAIKEWSVKNNITIPEENAFTDKATGGTFLRQGYLKMKKMVQDGDTIVIKELDRLGRDWDMIKEEWGYFLKLGVTVVVTDFPLLSMPIERDGIVDLSQKLIRNMMFELLCYNAQMEKQTISRRTKEALQALKKKGVVLGKPIDEEKENAVLDCLKRGFSVNKTAEVCNTSRTQVYRVKDRHNIKVKKNPNARRKTA